MSGTNLRPIMVKMPDHSRPTRDLAYLEVAASFHQWGIDDEGRSCAIVEFGDGTVAAVMVNQIRFLTG